MTQPELAASVVVPTHRGAHRLPALLEALAAQDATDPWEVVVVVDGADEETEAVLAAAPGDLPLRVVRHDVARGVSAALNAGTAAARGRVVVRCDDDLSPAPDMLRRHLAHHVGDEPVGVVGPTRDVLPDTPYARAYGRSATERSVAGVLAASGPDRWRHWAAHCSVRRDVLEAIGGYDEAMAYREDSELGLRLVRHGVRIVVDPGLVLPHRGAPADARTRVARAWVSGASEVALTARHPGVTVRDAAPAAGPAARAWSLATLVAATAMPSRAAAARVGGLLDRILHRVAPTFGGRLVALAVEAAARSGRDHGTADQAGYGGQKDDELRAEGRRDRGQR
ncbi:glycosyltransferase [Phycicoccus sp. CSK15P-2]|uniref:glycosyltransferase n=1 Tax=Phycicoccus sp. CSK15P-2 TaxID=2807627 RepID=UPI00194E3EC1|nr:glycosyltransferase [Phycicoccus sp. CSK15P-2]MBM6404295.1 glycosyltransferase [Phycicoccus sp. CSK15P-2]